MNKLFTQRERAIFYATAGIIGFGLVLNFLIVPVFNKNMELNRQINFSKAKLAKYARLLSRKDDIQSKYGAFLSQPNLSGSEKDSLINLLSELENLAGTANVRIIDIRPQSSNTLSRYNEIPVDLRLEGQQDGYLKFIYGIENSPSLLKIKKIQLSSKANSELLEAAFSIAQISSKE